ncbi:MAG: hypothetical protein ISF22_11180 [Methanomassiliicoccus sp.]|nr:hypothetical protein [Methanomassiliicoccus sp.]
MSSKQRSIAALVVAGLMIAGCLMMPSSQAEDLELVPEPWVHETHDFDVPIDTNVPNSGMCDERWSMEVRHGEVLTLLMAREMDQNGGKMVDYTFNVHYDVDDTQYIAQFMIMYCVIKVGDQTYNAPLTSCEGFYLTYTPIQYSGSVPSFYCNITYQGVQVYTDMNAGSTFDLTLCHRVTADWDRTDIKVEALFDFTNTALFQPFSNTELAPGTPFTAEIHYGMMVHKAHAIEQEGPLVPTGHTNDTLQYALTLDNGAPLTLSKMQMDDRFSITNSTGSYGSIGYSSMDYAASCHVVHGFPGLTYKDTISMKSDPEITIYHDRVTAGWNNDGGWNNDDAWPSFLLPIALIGAAAIIGVAVVVMMRKRGRSK